MALRRPFAGSGLPPGFAGGGVRPAAVPGPGAACATTSPPTSRWPTAGRPARPLHGDPLRRRAAVLTAPDAAAAARVRAARRPPGLARPGRFDWTCRGGRPELPARAAPDACAHLFGERLRYERRGCSRRGLERPDRLLRGVPGSFGPFGPLEESQRLPPGRALLASAGTGEPRRAASSSTAVDGGVVARVGVDGFGRALPYLARRRADNAQAMGPALAVVGAAPKARGRAGRRWRRRRALVDRDAAPPRCLDGHVRWCSRP